LSSRDARARQTSAPASSPPRATELLEGAPSDRLLQEWEELAVSCGASPWNRPGWITAWWACMGSQPPALLTVREGSDRTLRAVLPLQASTATLRSPTNWHTPEFDLVGDGPEARAEVLRGALSRARCVRLDFVDRGLAELVRAESHGLRGHSHIRLLERSPYVDLAQWRGAPRQIAAELRRDERRLKEQGALTLEVMDGRDGLGPLEEGLRLEASGWKGQQGTAVLNSPATASFYRRIADWAAGEGLLRLVSLRLEGRAIAFDMAVEHAGRHYLLKTGYDEAYRSVAPGKVLRLSIIEHCAARGLTRYEFLGDAQPWKADWTDLLRDRFQVLGFAAGAAGAVPRVLHSVVLPTARKGRQRLAAARSGSGGG
jgi:CelD/BcsL family acetyltransferase involved in cellulose biosynthesis